MRSPSLYFISAVMLTASASALAASGLHKHDQSIATYNYDVEIRTHEAGDASSASDASASVMQHAASSAMGGKAAPDFQLARDDGQIVTLNDLVKQGPVLVLFAAPDVQGVRQMELLQKNLAQLQKMGVNIVAISPAPLDSIHRMRKSYGISYDVLSDASHYAAQQYGLHKADGVASSLYSIDRNGQIVAMQVAGKGKAAFDLNEATLPLRGETAVMEAAPAPAQEKRVPPVMEKQAMEKSVAETPVKAPVARRSSVTPDEEMMETSPVRNTAPSQSTLRGAQGLAPSQPMPDTPTPAPFQSGTNPTNSGTNNSDSVNSGASNSGAVTPSGSVAGSGGVSYNVPPSNPEYGKAEMTTDKTI